MNRRLSARRDEHNLRRRGLIDLSARLPDRFATKGLCGESGTTTSCRAGTGGVTPRAPATAILHHQATKLTDFAIGRKPPAVVAGTFPGENPHIGPDSTPPIPLPESRSRY
jgi:hypothetical protein